MKSELQEKLYSKYPKVFRNRHLSPQETCMCWGIECGDGWFWLIDSMLEYLTYYTEKGYDIIADQVKEKFGGLRFYYSIRISDKCSDNDTIKKISSDRICEIVDYCLALSLKICEQCGSNENVLQTNSNWIETLCDKCKEEKCSEEE